MAISSLRLDTRRALADGTFPVQIKVGYGTDIYLATGVYLKRDEWQARSQQCVGKHARVINNILTTTLTRVTNRILELRESGRFNTYTRAQLRQMLTDLTLDAPTVDLPTLGYYLDKLIASKKGKTADTYRYAKMRVEGFANPHKTPVSDMSAAWWSDLISSMEADGLSHNTRHLYISAVKSAVRYAEEDGVAVNPAYKKVASKMDTNTPMRNLPVEALREIRDAVIDRRAEVYRDAFMLSFYLIGINAADLIALKKSDVVNGRINYKRSKTGRHYSIKIEPEAKEIIDRYAAPAGDPRLLSFGASTVASFTVVCSRWLNTVRPGLTWYYARYSWANYAIDLDVPKDIVSECLGHSHGAAVTGVYIRYTHDKIDKANRQVLDYFADKK